MIGQTPSIGSPRCFLGWKTKSQRERELPKAFVAPPGESFGGMVSGDSFFFFCRLAVEEIYIRDWVGRERKLGW